MAFIDEDLGKNNFFPTGFRESVKKNFFSQGLNFAHQRNKFIFARI